MIVLILIIALFVSYFSCYLIIKFSSNTFYICNDPVTCEPQKFHKIPVPRIGGVAIVAGFLITSIFTSFMSHYTNESAKLFEKISLLAVCVLPAFLCGLFEDITKNGSVKLRLIFIAISAMLAINFFEIAIHSIGITLLDHMLTIKLVSYVFSIFAIVGVTNAFNIIDGLNGLASGSAIIVLLAISYVSYVLGEQVSMLVALTILSSLVGFFKWNFPKGKIFLGDGGAYFIGFIIAVLIMSLVQNNPTISPWFALMVILYPVTETLFSIYRRKVIRKRAVGKPDAIHLHTLIYRRLVRCMSGVKDTYHVSHRSSQAAFFLWVMTLLASLPAVIFRENTNILIVHVILFVSFYIWLYRSIVKFKTPKIINLRYWRDKKLSKTYKIATNKKDLLQHKESNILP